MAPAPLHSEPIPFITLPNWVKAAARCGFNVETVFRQLGIETDLLYVESATVPAHKLRQAMEACVRRSTQHHFPFVLGDSFAFDYLPDLETFLSTSGTLREATKVFGWVRELINPMIDVQLVGGDHPQLLLQLPPEEGDLPYFCEAVFATIVKFGRTLMAGQGDFEALRVAYPPPPHARSYREFFRMPVYFDSDVNALEFESRLLDKPRPGGYPTLHEQARLRIERRLQRLPRRGGIVMAIEQALESDPQLFNRGIEGVAEHLGLHVRTLQRRLAVQGERYGELVDRVRYRLALKALEAADEDIEALSLRLGFSDRRSFTRAFKRWAGVAPSRLRADAGHAGSEE